MKAPKDRLTASQIVDDFFHEYCEGRFDRSSMIEAIVTFGVSMVDEKIEFKKKYNISMRFLTCHVCDNNHDCEYAFDAYNTDGDCLAVK